MEAYKVLRRIDGQLRSCIVYDDPNLGVVYEPGRRIHAPVGELWVFPSLDDALRFADKDGDQLADEIEVWRVNCPGLRYARYCVDVGYLGIHHVERFWRLGGIRHNVQGLPLNVPPVGSFTTPWVELVERVA